MDNAGLFLIAGAGALFVLSQSSEASLGGGGGTGSPVSNAEEGKSGFDLSQLGNLLNGFTSPATPDTTNLNAPSPATTSKKQASASTSYDEGNGQTVNALNFSSQTLGGSAYASPSGQVFAPNFSSQVFGGPAYASPLTTKKAEASLNYTPANANFSSATQGAIFVQAPTTSINASSNLTSSNNVSTTSNNSKSSSVGSTKKQLTSNISTNSKTARVLGIGKSKINKV